MIEALVFGCDMDWDLAWGLESEEDYLQEVVENYDFHHHLIVSAGTYEGRKTGALYFIRLHTDVQEVTADGVKKTLDKATRPTSDESSKPKRKKTLTKKMVETYVRDYQIDPILDAAREDKKIMRYLQRLLYSGDDLFRWRAAETLGKACAIISRKDPGIISNLLQGLFSSITDTAAFSMGAFESIGEIISSRPDLFGGYAPQLYQFIGDKTQKVQSLQALSRIAKASPDLLRKHTLYFFKFLEDPDPSVRGYTALLMGNLGAHEARRDLEKLVQESHEIEIFNDGELQTKTVGQVATEALGRL
jgi:HEAT repeat protein